MAILSNLNITTDLTALVIPYALSITGNHKLPQCPPSQPKQTSRLHNPQTRLFATSNVDSCNRYSTNTVTLIIRIIYTLYIVEPWYLTWQHLDPLYPCVTPLHKHELLVLTGLYLAIELFKITLCQ